MTNKEALNYLGKILGLDNYPNGTEEDKTKDDYVFACIYQLNEELIILEEIQINHPDLYKLYKDMKEAERRFFENGK